MTRPSPKFQVSIRSKGSSGVLLIEGDVVGLASNINCGRLESVRWNDRFNQWEYTLYPWSEDERRWATEDVLIPIVEWLQPKLTPFVMDYCEILKASAKANDAYCRGPKYTAILTKYNALMSGRVRDVYSVIQSLTTDANQDIFEDLFEDK